MNTQENKIQTLAELLDQYEAGTLDMTEMARKCYMSEKEKHYNRVSWVHNGELKNHALLRKINNKDGRDLLRSL